VGGGALKGPVFKSAQEDFVRIGCGRGPARVFGLEKGGREEERKVGRVGWERAKNLESGHANSRGRRGRRKSRARHCLQ
jgi:hypothetical protein